MWTIARLLLVTIVLAAAPCLAEPAAQPPHRGLNHRLRRAVIRPLVRTRPPRPLMLPRLQLEPRQEFEVPPPLGPSPLERDQIGGGGGFLPHGFTFSLPIGDGARPPPPAALNRAIDVGHDLVSCWTPPTDGPWNSLTLRISFKRDGSVNGVPLIPYVDAGSAERKSGLAHSLLAALKQCTPLPFSPSLGSAIAGEIFAIRFIHQDRR